MQEPLPGPTTGRMYIARIQQVATENGVRWCYSIECPDKGIAEGPGAYPTYTECLEEARDCVRCGDQTYQEG